MIELAFEIIESKIRLKALGSKFQCLLPSWNVNQKPELIVLYSSPLGYWANLDETPSLNFSFETNSKEKLHFKSI